MICQNCGNEGDMHDDDGICLFSPGRTQYTNPYATWEDEFRVILFNRAMMLAAASVTSSIELVQVLAGRSVSQVGCDELQTYIKEWTPRD
jgi:hypothetical protein